MDSCCKFVARPSVKGCSSFSVSPRDWNRCQGWTRNKTWRSWAKFKCSTCYNHQTIIRVIAPCEICLKSPFSYLFWIILCIGIKYNYDFRTELTQNTNILVTCSLQPFKPKLYPHIKFSALIFIHFLKELLKRIYFCPSGNHFINSHIRFSWLSIDSVKRKLTLVSWDLRS